jgi:hypothetical protein
MPQHTFFLSNIHRFCYLTILQENIKFSGKLKFNILKLEKYQNCRFMEAKVLKFADLGRTRGLGLSGGFCGMGLLGGTCCNL